MATGWTVNDLEPPLSGTVKDGAKGVDLTSATSVTAHIQKPNGVVFSRPVTRLDQVLTRGSWTMAWQTGDLNVPGRYSAEIEVVWPGVRPQTFGLAVFPVGQEIAIP